MLFTVGHVLAGIVISVVVVAGLAVAVPWLVAHRDAPDAVDGEPEERFSESMRIVRRDVEDYAESLEGPDVSTPLTRRAELTELQLLARQAAGRRARTAAILASLTLVMAVIAGVTAMSWWLVLIPFALFLAFFVASPVMVRAMHKRFDARAQAIDEGYDDMEHTQIFVVAEQLQEDEESSTIDVDLTAPEHTGSLWDAVPVTTPTYVSKPLVPRTVRTIDLSSPVPASSPLIPTADHPNDEAAEVEDAGIVRPRVVGE